MGDDAAAHIAKLELLEVLSLDASRLTNRGLERLQSCKSLRELRLDGCRMEKGNLNFLSKLLYLKKLSLRRMHASEKAVLNLPVSKQLIELELEMAAGSLSNVLESIKGLQQLRVLSVRRDKLLPDEVTRLSEMHQLDVLDLGNTVVTSPQYGELKFALHKTDVRADRVVRAPNPEIQ